MVSRWHHPLVRSADRMISARTVSRWHDPPARSAAHTIIDSQRPRPQCPPRHPPISRSVLRIRPSRFRAHNVCLTVPLPDSRPSRLRPRCSPTVLAHGARPRCSPTVLAHGARPRCSPTVLAHGARARSVHPDSRPSRAAYPVPGYSTLVPMVPATAAAPRSARSTAAHLAAAASAPAYPAPAPPPAHATVRPSAHLSARPREPASYPGGWLPTCRIQGHCPELSPPGALSSGLPSSALPPFAFDF